MEPSSYPNGAVPTASEQIPLNEGQLWTDSAKSLPSPEWTGLPIETGERSQNANTFEAEIPYGQQQDAAFWADGGGDSRRRRPVAAIFIHAGAGYHSVANERLHLEACGSAAREAMKLLNDGKSALDAVERAIQILEDNEITNAGYGSNLSIDGTVECDATIVDHLGRSGACGAVPNIKNPIRLAKLILDKSSQPLSLRRVPPNLLIGEGAKEFAWQHNMPLIPNEWLVSHNARDRYRRWDEDLKRAERHASSVASTPTKTATPEVEDDVRSKGHRDHTNAILTGTWNEGQPDSPAGPATPSENGTQTPASSPLKQDTPSTVDRPSPKVYDRSPLSFFGSARSSKSNFASLKSASPASGSPAPKRQRFPEQNGHGSLKSSSVEPDEMRTRDGAVYSEDVSPKPITPSFPDSSSLSENLQGDSIAAESAVHQNSQEPNTRARTPLESSQGPVERRHGASEDMITDTVGAIAIDKNGLMAAGSSSGGIGMKHRGRVGPAALVGIGTSVITADAGDSDEVVVGAVTSGTGEHMATTMASQKCAERLYYGTRRGQGGVDIKEDDESAIMDGFILNDFEEHPSVRSSSSASAIGVMAVKKTPQGFYLYFAHNTDSFALASMSSNDRSPACVMSRLPEKGRRISQGARKISLTR